LLPAPGLYYWPFTGFDELPLFVAQIVGSALQPMPGLREIDPVEER